MIAPAAPTLTEQTVPGPGVEVYFPSLDAAVDSITVWRIADGETVVVRGAKRVSASGAFAVTDWEVPFGVVSTYYGEVFDVVGASLISPQSTITVINDSVIMSNPIDPGQQFTVELQAESLQGMERGTNNKQVYVMGVRRPFNQFWGEGALQNVPLEIWSRSSQETVNMRSISSAGQWLIRTPPLFDTLPRLLYVAVHPVRHSPFQMWSADNPVAWQLTVDEVQPVSASVLRPLVTWGRYEAGFPTPDLWSDVSAVYGGGTWIDMQRNPPIV